jgi:LPXTG-motif cell wall-anchored protein
LTDDDDVVDGSLHYTGGYSCVLGDTTISDDWDLLAGGPALLIDHIPAGSVCTITENSLAAAPSSLDSSYHWLSPNFSQNNVTIEADVTANVVVQNGVRRGLGDLQLVKVLDDPFKVVATDRVYTGTFVCRFNGSVITPQAAKWSATAGGPAITLATNLPEGTVCTVAEDDLVAPPLAGFPQYEWAATKISPSPVRIADGETHLVTVTNTVIDPFGTQLSTLAVTGTNSVLPLALGGGVVLLGVVLFFVARRRRLQA